LQYYNTYRAIKYEFGFKWLYCVVLMLEKTSKFGNKTAEDFPD